MQARSRAAFTERQKIPKTEKKLLPVSGMIKGFIPYKWKH